MEETLDIVSDAAHALGVNVGDTVRALLDAHSVNFSGSAISLHGSEGVPLRKLGLGSSRLLVAGLQNRVAENSSVALVDEVEIGLEPHRISKFLLELGSKNEETSCQIFMTTHSPIVLRELSGSQLYIIRSGDEHSVVRAGTKNAIQGTLRAAAEAFLGTHVLVCEGATEVGLVRGHDRYLAEKECSTFAAAGGVLVDAGGVDKIYRTAASFQALGYGVATLRDDDVQPKEEDEKKFIKAGGTVFKWTEGWAIEAELFDCVSDDVILELWAYVKKLHGKQRVLDHLRTACAGPVDPEIWFDDLDDEKREKLAIAAGNGSWFKRISHMEEAAYSIICPHLDDCVQPELQDRLDKILRWSGAADD
ncbi:AAA family ATPase [uncultured Ruegeria sp.]|uniref:ATP-dependent nuclease n=1 Tax=uncultured Ruegeria sp. TaxID=259304 RepID=UPI002631A847|nr:AAA family ATPase [uncultured Ruegeria sp.]